MKLSVILYWAARILAAVIMAQTLFYKFSASEESVYIFTQVGIEPWGRIAAGVVELIASILILISATAWIGAGLALGTMGGALISHLTILGIVVRGDHGQLFIYAVLVAISSIYVLYCNKERIKNILMAIVKR